MTSLAPLLDRPTASGTRAANGRSGAYDDVTADRTGRTRAVLGPVLGPVAAVAGPDLTTGPIDRPDIDPSPTRRRPDPGAGGGPSRFAGRLAGNPSNREDPHP